MAEAIPSLSLDLIRLQAQAQQILKDAPASLEDIMAATASMAELLAISLSAVADVMGLTEDQAMALLILVVIQATEVDDG